MLHSNAPRLVYIAVKSKNRNMLVILNIDMHIKFSDAILSVRIEPRGDLGTSYVSEAERVTKYTRTRAHNAKTIAEKCTKIDRSKSQTCKHHGRS